MKCVTLKIDLMQVPVIVSNVETEINSDANANNWLIKVYAINDLFGIQLIANVNVRNLVILVSISNMETVIVERKLVDKLVEECTENINEVKLAKQI